MLKFENIEVIEMIPPALNTDLGGKGLHDGQPPVSDFVNSVFQQLNEVKTELTFVFSEIMAKATQDMINETINKINNTIKKKEDFQPADAASGVFTANRCINSNYK